ncbi:DUF1501 domain-containing protein [Fulvivirga sedimenti]|uniref:DUF1501 domain-containing protein n=1 Tax=Fulvivirga sedimenti TaxID=2879465 RepID=A0A9X1HK99_9BACT|nr:DUF1501 domain-containing protein [Fulvivirga sedimenti]MCA6073749.1 DUF1501 domain-containing protein [Fulvivirga sedimenti]
MHCHDHDHKPITRRDFFTKASLGLGALSFASLLNPASALGNALASGVRGPHFAPRAKRIIYLNMIGAPSQIDLFDYKPLLHKMHGQELPDSVLGDRLTSTSATQATLPIVKGLVDFKQRGQSGMWMSDLLPYMSQTCDELCMVKSMFTESVQHEPAQMFTHTGSEIPGRPTFGSWVSYGLGTENENLPNYIVLMTKGNEGGFSRLYSSGFLPAEYQGVRFRSGKDAVLYLTNPPGVEEATRREQLDYLQKLQKNGYDEWEDPTITAKMAQYEMAFRMQTSVPEVMNVEEEPDYIYEMYGEDSKKPGTFAANCLLARRLAERGVRFIQLYHGGWDHHSNLPKGIRKRCQEVDQGSAALIMDLKQRGLLEDTLVIWGGEFGRTSFSQGELTKDNFGRDHHSDAFTILMAGAGVKKGFTFGETDDFGYHITENPVHIHDLNATLMHILGIDHERLTYKFQGRRFRLTDVHGKVVKDILT